MIPLFYPPKQNVFRMMWNIYKVLRSRWWGQGDLVDQFEIEFAKMFHYKYCVMTNSGTSALHLAYILAGIRPTDEVIVPALTCTATCHPLKMMGARIIFADIRPDTLTLDPIDLRRKITKKTKAVVPVHLGGAVMTGDWFKVCKDRKIAVIEDACQALGCGSVGVGKFACFSFQAIKSLSTGDGGMLAINSSFEDAEECFKRAKRLRWFSIDREAKAAKEWQAWDRRGITFDQDEIGYKYQPTNIDAAIGLAGLKDFRSNQKRRHNLANLYIELLKDAPQVELLSRPDEHADWLFMVKVNGDRDDFAEYLMRAGIETNVAHIRNDIFKIFGGQRRKLPNMDAVENRYICLPLNNQVSKGDVEYICKIITEWDAYLRKDKPQPYPQKSLFPKNVAIKKGRAI